MLGLAGQQVSPSLQDELDLFCYPGVSFGIYHGPKGKYADEYCLCTSQCYLLVVGGGFCLAVPGPGGGFAGGGGDFIPASTWHSAAARLATESEDPAWLWRRAQATRTDITTSQHSQLSRAAAAYYQSLTAMDCNVVTAAAVGSPDPALRLGGGGGAGAVRTPPFLPRPRPLHPGCPAQAPTIISHIFTTVVRNCYVRSSVNCNAD